jgi:hypothetical protein
MTTSAAWTQGLATRATSIVFAMAALAIVSYGTFADNVPNVLSPFSFPVVIWLFPSGGEVFAVMILPVLFLLWSLNLVSGRVEFPLRSAVLTVVLAAGSVAWFALGWSYGVKYQGIGLTVSWVGISLGLAVFLIVWARHLRQRPTWWRVLAFNWLLFAWPAWCGFPWLGELP